MTDAPMSAEKRDGAVETAEAIECELGLQFSELELWKASGMIRSEIRQAEADARKAALEEAGERVCLVCERRVRALSEKPR